MITARNNLESLDATRDFVMTDTPDEPTPEVARHHRPLHVALAWSALVGVVLTATLSDLLNRMNPAIPSVPIHYAAMIGALALLWLRVMTPREAYASIDWQVLLMLYGLLGLGMAMQNTGTAEWLARGMVGIAESVVPAPYMAIVMLWLIFLLTLCLTEVLSNNATAVMMIPIAVSLAVHLGVNPRPFIILRPRRLQVHGLPTRRHPAEPHLLDHGLFPDPADLAVLKRDVRLPSCPVNPKGIQHPSPGLAQPRDKAAGYNNPERVVEARMHPCRNRCPSLLRNAFSVRL